MVWSWGQFMDHDMVATVDNVDGQAFDIAMSNGDQSAQMTLFRLTVDQSDGKCRVPLTVNTPVLDAGPVYGTNEEYLKVRS